jgi:ATP-dependent DNA helicase RecQ
LYHAYIPISKDGERPKILKLLSVLELFGLATYEIYGGKNIEIFIRINDPVKLKRLSLGKYHNVLLSKIEEKRDVSQKTMQKFMSHDFTDEERWDIVEQYFLGREEYLDQLILEKERTY